MIFERRYPIRFSHCDPAGIIFYPQYFVLFNDQLEDWFDTELGTGFAELHRDRRLGVPTVRIECDFSNPSRHGEQVLFTLGVTRIGNASVHLLREARLGDQVRMRMHQVLACMDLDAARAIPWPDDLREAMSRWSISPIG